MSKPREDPVLRSARREALVVLATWIAALTYTITYCALLGYGRPAEELKFVLGFPDWVFWGIIAPWGVCAVVACWFSYSFMADEDLGEDPDGSAHPPDASEEVDHA
jgi:hypothetical protein